MRRTAGLLIAVTLVVSCNHSSDATAGPNPKGPDQIVVKAVVVRFGGGNGESTETAIVVHAPDEDVGVSAEYDYLSAIYGTPRKGWTRLLQGFLERGDRQYDQLDIVDLSDNSHRSFFFDITEYYGK